MGLDFIILIMQTVVTPLIEFDFISDAVILRIALVTRLLAGPDRSVMGLMKYSAADPTTVAPLTHGLDWTGLHIGGKGGGGRGKGSRPHTAHQTTQPIPTCNSTPQCHLLRCGASRLRAAPSRPLVCRSGSPSGVSISVRWGLTSMAELLHRYRGYVAMGDALLASTFGG